MLVGLARKDFACARVAAELPLVCLGWENTDRRKILHTSWRPFLVLSAIADFMMSLGRLRIRLPLCSLTLTTVRCLMHSHNVEFVDHHACADMAHRKPTRIMGSLAGSKLLEREGAWVDVAPNSGSARQGSGSGHSTRSGGMQENPCEDKSVARYRWLAEECVAWTNAHRLGMRSAASRNFVFKRTPRVHVPAGPNTSASESLSQQTQSDLYAALAVNLVLRLLTPPCHRPADHGL